VATRLGLESKSFDRAAGSYTDAVGQSISGDSVRRIAEGWGRQVEAQRAAEAEQASAPAQRGENPTTRRVAEQDPIAGAANISTDGGMMLIRGEGWKEVKMAVISAVDIRPAEERPAKESEPSRRAGDPVVRLTDHSYQVGLWDADTMARYQYAEGLRRGIDHCRRLSSVNDGAPWIGRITSLNFPAAIQIVDWSHAEGKLWQVSKAVFGEQSVWGRSWVAAQLDSLWRGGVDRVAAALRGLDLNHEGWPAEVHQSPGYFEGNCERMRYDEFRAQGYPIGSGTVESGINTVVHHRMKRPGQGWGRSNGQAMLAALGELHSGRFEQAWQATLPRAA
jgi:hypothetical protein